MQCPNCNEPIQSEAVACPHCGHNLSVTVLSRQERDNFNGLTIDDDNSHNRGEQHSSYETGETPGFKRIQLSFGSSSWISNLVLAAVLAVTLFFFLPIIMFVLLAVGAAVFGFWLLRRLLK